MSFLNINDPKHLFKRAIIILTGIYFVWHAFHPGVWIFLNSVNLLIHEAGHLIFSLMGEFIGIAGGSIMQILIPLLFVLYFWRREGLWQASIVMFWLGESILEVAFYARDAQSMSIPLLGGDGTIHDWNYLLTSLKLLSYTIFISAFIFLVGFSVILGAVIIGLNSAPLRRQSPKPAKIDS